MNAVADGEQGKRVENSEENGGRVRGNPFVLTICVLCMYEQTV